MRIIRICIIGFTIITMAINCAKGDQRELLCSIIEKSLTEALDNYSYTDDSNIEYLRNNSIYDIKMMLTSEGVDKEWEINDFLNATAAYRYLSKNDRDIVSGYYSLTGELPNIYIEFAVKEIEYKDKEEVEFWCKLAIDRIKSKPESFEYMCIRLLSTHTDIGYVKDFLIWLPMDINSSMHKYKKLDTQDKGDLSKYANIHDWYLEEVIRANGLEDEYDNKRAQVEEYMRYLDKVSREAGSGLGKGVSPVI
ncbi:MAG: hypothetical protein JXR40_02315 [Pontiellaceae bacterium]|nr:hypothetical protein [Pontiellaceae bacterium]